MLNEFWLRTWRAAVSAASLFQTASLAARRSGSVSLAMARGVSIFAGLATIPLLTRHLGASGFGIYATLTSLLAWLGLLQLGFGPTVINALSGKDLETRDAEGLVATAFWLQLGITVVVVCVGTGVWHFLDWAALLNAPPSEAPLINVSVLIVIFGVALRLPLSLGRPLLMVKGYTNTAGSWDTASALATLTALMVVVALQLGLPAVLAVTVGVPAAMAGGAFLHAVVGAPRLLPRWSRFAWCTAKSLLRSASHFTVITIAAAVIAATDNFIIAATLGPERVTPYAVTLRLFQFTLIFGGVVLEAYWPRYRAAFVNGELIWLRTTHKRLRRLIMFLIGLTVLSMYAVGELLIRWWAGPAAAPDSALIAALSLLAIAQAMVMADGRLLEAAGETAFYAKAGAANAVVNLTSSLVLVQLVGAPGVAIGTALGYAAVIPAVRGRAKRVLRTLGD